MQVLSDISLVTGDVGRVNPLATADWDVDLHDCESASFFHTTAWARVLQDTYGYTPLYYILRVGDRVRSILPVMEVNSRLTGKRGISLPFTDACEPVSDDAAAFRQLVHAALDEGTLRRWNYLEVRGGKDFFSEAPASTAFYGHSLDLSDPEARLEPSVRRAIRKAEQSDLHIEFATDDEAVQAFFQLQGRTRQRHGVPPPPFRFLKNIQRHILDTNRGFIVVAWLQRMPVAAAVFFQFGKSAIFKYGASDERFQQQRANNLLMWKAIEWHAANGFTWLDMGRTSLANEGLRRFKLGWGSTEQLIEYIRYDYRQKAFVTAPDQSVSWHNRVFHHTPVPLARLIGAALYKHVA